MLQIEVVITDEYFKIIGGTRFYGSRVGLRMEPSFILPEIFRTQKPLVIPNPGEHTLCRPCPKYRNCPETVEIDCPIIFNGSVIGVITAEGYTKEQRSNFLNMQEVYLEYLERMSELIAGKVAEKQKSDQVGLVLNQLQAIMNSVNEAIMVINERGVITHFNPSAEKITKTKAQDALLRHINELFPSMPLLEVLETGTGFTDQEIRQNLNGGALHYVVTAKPLWNNNKVEGVVATFRDISEIRSFVYKMLGHKSNFSFEDIQGEDEQFCRVVAEAKKVSLSSSTVLIRGESGTGKEIFAQAIHAESMRRNGPIITLNCAAIPEPLLESELFGYEEGAFTGARQGGKPGKFELATGGTMFLDEIGDMSLYLQAKLLRVLQEKRIERVGGIDSIPVDVRIVAATNKDLEDMVSKGEFRSDLYYRLNVISISIPSLRQRKNDIEILMRYFLEKYNSKMGKNVTGITREAKQVLYNYNWPGNVRELENVIECAINMAVASNIILEDLPKRLIENKDVQKEHHDINLKILSKSTEKNAVLEAVNRFGWTTQGKEQAAQHLGISLSTLYRRLRNN
ncbi:MAG: sigma 54-interacting transcriptional regulator [Bacillota bacterium]